MTGRLSKNFHGVGIGPLSKILAVNRSQVSADKLIICYMKNSTEGGLSTMNISSSCLLGTQEQGMFKGETNSELGANDEAKISQHWQT